MAYGVAAAAVIVCGAALIARLLPDLILDPSLTIESRLAYPLTYWNALGILACVGLILCFHFASSARDPRPARVLAAGAVPLLALTLLYTLSRGAIWAAALALVIYLVLGRPRGAPAALLAVGPPTLILALIATPTTAVSNGYPLLTVDAGRKVADALVLCMLAAMALRFVLAGLDRRVVALRLPAVPRGRPLVAALAGGVLALILIAVALGAPKVATDKYSEFTDTADTATAKGEARLLSVRPEARLALWDVALDAYRQDNFHGTGAGTYPLNWERERESNGHILDAHSAYLETLGDLGLVGALALVVALVSILGAFAYRARGPDRALFAALFAAGVAWALHAAVDWDWQMPAVTFWLFALGGTALSRSLRRRRRRSRRSLRRIGVRVAGVAFCLAVAVLPARIAISQARLESSLGAMQRGECGPARAEARSALDAVGERPTPYQVIGYCDLEQGRYRAALGAMTAAQDRDPHSATANYDLAVARAAAGLDPTRAIGAATHLSPLEPRAREAAIAFAAETHQAWLRSGREATLIPPAPEGP
jgi:O-antigen ligase